MYRFSIKTYNWLAFLLYTIAAVVVIYVALAGIVIRESLSFIVYGSAVAAIGVAHIPVILNPYHRHYLWALTIIAAMLGLVSLIFLDPFSGAVLAVVPGAAVDVYAGLRDPTDTGGKSRKR